MRSRSVSRHLRLTFLELRTGAGATSTGSRSSTTSSSIHAANVCAGFSGAAEGRVGAALMLSAGAVLDLALAPDRLRRVTLLAHNDP